MPKEYKNTSEAILAKMLFDRLKINQRSDAGWVYLEDGLQYTSNLTVIRDEVHRLIKEKTWVELRGPGGYRSTPTFVVNYTNGMLEIDRPTGWPNLNRAAIVYRRECEPWHFMDLTPCGSSDSGIFFNTPRLFVIYEKRESYRVTAPSRSKVIVYKEVGKENSKPLKSRHWNGIIKDISVTGICFYLPLATLRFPSIRSRIGPVVLDLLVNSMERWPILEIPEAEVVRHRQLVIDGKKMQEVALHFIGNEQERTSLQSYIRKREMEILKAIRDLG